MTSTSVEELDDGACSQSGNRFAGGKLGDGEGKQGIMVGVSPSSVSGRSSPAPFHAAEKVWHGGT
jgi:hypothetical protein